MEAQNLDLFFRALADPTRRAILDRLLEREQTVGDISRPFGISLPAISRHLKALEKAKLIERRVRGREHYCRLNPGPFIEVRDWLVYYTKFWDERQDAQRDAGQA
ncbi:MAG: ArsR/SmtB family transcription factor [Gammaproteobacteria bacterium]